MRSFLKPSFLITALLSTSANVSATFKGSWLQKSKQTLVKKGEYGKAVSMSSTLLAIGAPYNTPSEPLENAGLVQILKRDGDKLTLVKEVYGKAEEELGHTVAVAKGTGEGGLNEEMVVVGAPRGSRNGDTNSGLAQVFYFSDLHEEWRQLGKDIVGKWDDEFFGEHVAISDDGMIVCVGTGVGDSQHKGVVYVYYYNEVGNRWDEMGAPLEGPQTNARFGTSVDIVTYENDEGDYSYYIAVGAPKATNAYGIVQVYKYDDNEREWSTLGEPLRGDLKRDQLGQSLSMAKSGSLLLVAVGSPSRSQEGHVQVYKYNLDKDEDETEWTYFGDEMEELYENDGTGEVVELSDDGMLLAIGSPYAYDNQGTVRVFQYDHGYDTYIRIGDEIKGKKEQRLGSSLSFSGKDLAVGSPYQNLVEVFSYDGNALGAKSTKGRSGFGKFVSTVVILGVVGFLSMFAYKKLRSSGFRWGSLAAAMPGGGQRREAVNTNDEWPFPFFSSKERERIEEVRRQEEERGRNVDDLRLHGMPRSTSMNSQDVESSGSSSSGSDDDEQEMRKIT